MRVILRLLVRIMIQGYYPFLLTVILAAFALSVYWLMHAFALGRGLGFLHALGGAVVMGALGHFAFLLSYLLRPVSKEDPFEVRLPSAQLAGLRQLAWEIAEERGLPPPDDLRLDGETIACVYEEAKMDLIRAVTRRPL